MSPWLGARQHGRFIEQRLALVPTLPESTGTSVFAIGTSGDRLIERLHEPGKAAEPLLASVKSIRVAKQGLF
ncbi:MAG: hypothetical protein WBV39_17030, partial [Rudaea sp.]